MVSLLPLSEGMFDTIRVDLEQARKVNGIETGFCNRWLKTLMHPGTLAVLVYRFSSWARTVRVPVVRQALLLAASFVRYSSEVILGVEIAPSARIGPGLVVHTASGVFIAATTIGRNCVVQHGVCISHGVRSVGDDVYFGPGAKVIGRAAIGNNVRVVANSVVMTDVADNFTVVGVPARIRWKNRVLRETSNGVSAATAARHQR
jgi:serine O-acetyltransferase